LVEIIAPDALNSLKFPSGVSWVKKKYTSPIKKQIRPVKIMEYRQASVSETPKPITMAAIKGIPKRSAPPPKFPHPAEVALAVPNILGANMSDVCTWVITKEAPI